MVTNVRPPEELLKSLNGFIDSLNWNKSPESLYEPVDYFMQIGGKRIRPLVLLYIHEILKGNSDAALNAAYGMELFHNFTLVHDDIMDAAETRRGKQTVHLRFGGNAAILSGDVMLIESFRFIRTAEALSGRQGLVDLFIQTAREVCEGQALDMDFEKRMSVGLEEYIYMIQLKTAVLLASCFRMGADLSGMPDIGKELYELGCSLGVGFQLEDDWLDYYGNPMSVGKIWAGDIRRGKKSALILELQEHLDPGEREDFMRWYHSETNESAKLEGVGELFERYAVKDSLRRRIEQYKIKNTEIVDRLSLSQIQKDLILSLVLQIAERNF